MIPATGNRQPVVMFGPIFTAEAFQKNVVGEGALAFRGPLMWSWAIIPVTGLMRSVWTALLI
jgi:hypothetical protein